ncbi:MAG TPA: DUF4350 domain-containing protein, partial [Prosthecobacter sp.]|nr:DUF4350 domain-containing protein [Prosthecobacter sp.]
MRLEDLTIALRPRQSWEAIDLGCTLARRDYGRLLALWTITVLPLWAIIAFFLRDWPLIFPFVAWWLKPLYDRVPLFFISRAAFGVRPSIGECLRAWPRLWSRFLLSALIFRRFSFIRSFALPIWMLEGQRGRAVRARVKTLATDAGGSGVLASWVFLKLEFAAYLGLWALIEFAAPESGVPNIIEIILSFFTDSALEEPATPAQLWFQNCLYLTAITLTEIFYVGAGFGLYLNSRIKLEGWDIELTFRKLAARLQAPLTALVLLVLTCLPAFAAPAPAAAPGKSPAAAAQTASPSEEDSHDDDPAAEAAGEILSRPEFIVHKRIQKVPDFGSSSDLNSGANLGWVAHLLKALGWLIAGAVVCLLIAWLIRNRHLLKFTRRLARPQAPTHKPRVLMGMDVTRESLPADLLSAARAAWQAGHLREALSLLYRGALSRLIEQRRLPIRDSDTEDDCLLHVARSGDRTVTDYFRRLTLLWVRAAYAGIEAAPHEFDDLCRAWPFDHAPSRKPAAAAVPPIFLLGLCLLSSSCKWREEEIILGYKGPARSDPFLAAQILLREFDYQAAKLTVLKTLPEDPEYHVLILSGENGISEGRARQLLDWVDKGGHLIYALAGCRPYNDHGLLAGMSNYAYFGNEDRADPILQALKVEIQDRRQQLLDDMVEEAKAAQDDPIPPPAPADEDKITTAEDVSLHTYKLKWNSRTYRLALPDYVTFNLDRKLRTGEFSAGPVDEAAVLGLRRGLGRLTLLNHARPFRNRFLATADHAPWLLALVGEDTEQVQFVLSLESSFWSMLWQKGWPAIVGLAVLILFWLWRNLPRFGPVRHHELHETKHFTEHVTALGHFFHSLRRDDLLLTAAAAAVRTRALRRYPHLHA